MKNAGPESLGDMGPVLICSKSCLFEYFSYRIIFRTRECVLYISNIYNRFRQVSLSLCMYIKYYLRSEYSPYIIMAIHRHMLCHTYTHKHSTCVSKTSMTKTRPFKDIENFISKKLKIFRQKTLIFFIFLSKI